MTPGEVPQILISQLRNPRLDDRRIMSLVLGSVQ